MNSKLPLLLVVLAALAAFAQFTPDQSSSDQSTYSLTGTVQNSVSGEPIPHALVQVAGSSEAASFTDAGGRFEFDHLRAGMTVVPSTRKPGFLSPSEIDPAAPPPMVRIGADNAPITLKLVPEGVIFGRAQKPDGEPIVSLTVQLFSFEIAEGRKKWNLMNNTQTNDDGEFRIAALKPGRYYLAAGPRFGSTWIGAPGQRAREAAYQPVFYPSGRDLASAAPIDIAPGQQVEADFSLSPEPVFRISGSLFGLPADANPDEVWPRVQIVSRVNNMVAMPVAEQPGNEFQARVPAGSYVLRADVDTPHGSYRGEVPVTVQSDVAGVNLLVAPAPPIRIEVEVERTRTLPHRRASDQVRVLFRGQDMKLPTSEYESMAIAGGINTMNGVEPGTYAVGITPIGDLYLDSARCGGVDLLREDLTIREGAVPPIRISLRDDGGNIGGNVLSDGHGAAGATVLVIADRAPRQIKTAVTGMGGQFESPRLAPGDYTVLAFDRMAGIEYSNPEVMNAFLPNATHVSVTSNGESRISVNLIRTAK